MKQNPVLKWLLGALTFVVILVFSFPFIWMILASFKTQVQIMNVSQFFQFTPNLNNYKKVFGQYEFMRFITNSFIVAAGSTLVIITLPVLIIALLAQRYIVSGLAAGAVKG